MTTYQPQRFVTPPPESPPTRVTFAAEGRVRHAATLVIILGYINLAVLALFILVGIL
jgi:hypothetical protein